MKGPPAAQKVKNLNDSLKADEQLPTSLATVITRLAEGDRSSLPSPAGPTSQPPVAKRARVKKSQDSSAPLPSAMKVEKAAIKDDPDGGSSAPPTTASGSSIDTSCAASASAFSADEDLY